MARSCSSASRGSSSGRRRRGYNHLRLNDERRDLGVITTGIARNYYLENLDELGFQPSHLHIGAYPIPVEHGAPPAAAT